MFVWIVGDVKIVELLKTGCVQIGFLLEGGKVIRCNVLGQNTMNSRLVGNRLEFCNLLALKFNLMTYVEIPIAFFQMKDRFADIINGCYALRGVGWGRSNYFYMTMRGGAKEGGEA